MVFKLAKKNIKMNIQNYLLYFMASIFNVSIYFVFQNIWFNKEIGAFLEDDARLLMLFKGASFIILIFSIIFISYFSGFFIKKRKKELGLYSLLGMKKSDTAKMLFFENVFLGLFATIVGMILGLLLSKILMGILISILGLSLKLGFQISLGAFVNTFITFTILFFISSLYTSSMIYRFKLIDLFNSDKVTENVEAESKVKNIIGALITVFLIIVEFFAVFNIKDSQSFTTNVPIAFFAALIVTFMFFGTFLSFVGNRIKSNKKIYYKGNNIISVSSFLYRIKSNKRLLAVIALTNAVALTAISVTYSVDYNMKEIVKTTSPFSYCYVSEDRALDESVKKIILNSEDHQLIKNKTVELNKLKKGYLISESQYKEALESKGLTYKSKLKSPNETILVNYGSKELDSKIGEDVELSSDNLNNEFEIIDRTMIEPLNAMWMGYIFMVTDEVYETYKVNYNPVYINAYSITNDMEATKLTKAIIKQLPQNTDLSYSQSDKMVLLFTSMLLFIGIFVGLVFLSSTASILYFKQLSEATDDKKRYQILNKIGFSIKDTKIAIKKQVRAIFILPVVIGIVHTLIALTFLGNTISLSIKVPIVTSVIVYMLIYFLYYTLTVNTYVRIVTED